MDEHIGKARNSELNVADRVAVATLSTGYETLAPMQTAAINCRRRRPRPNRYQSR